MKDYRKPEIRIEQYIMDGTIAASSSACGKSEWEQQHLENYFYYVQYMSIGYDPATGIDGLPDGWGIGSQNYLSFMQDQDNMDDSVCYFTAASPISTS